MAKANSNRKHATRHQMHGLSGTAAYKVWCGMITRCYNSNDHAFPDYGGRGITICQRWRNSFKAFFDDMGERPSPKHMIERSNNEQGYNCGKCEDCQTRNAHANCCWATRIEQNRNRRDTELLTYHGETLPLVTLAERFGIRTTTLRNRLKNNWAVEEALETIPSPSTPKHRRSRDVTATVNLTQLSNNG